MSGRSYAFRLLFDDPSGPAEVEGIGSLGTRYHFLLGDAPEQWRSGVPGYESVLYRGLWPGVDLLFRAEDGRLVYELAAEPGAALPARTFLPEGAETVAGPGGPSLSTPLGLVRHLEAALGGGRGALDWAEVTGGSCGEAAAGSAAPAAGPPESGIAASGDHGRQLEWSTFLGGDRDDAVYALDQDGSGQVVVTGATRSTNFPTTVGALDETYSGSFDVVVSKLSADGSTLLWSTYLGASADDRGWALRLDGAGRPVVAGVTASADFPVTTGAYDETHNGEYDAFVAKLEADGSALVWSTFFGGDTREWDISGLVLGAGERPTFSGTTWSGNLPTSLGAFDTALDGTTDAFVARLEADGSALLLASYLGGSADEAGEDVDLDGSDRPVIVGRTTSDDFPTSAGSFQPSPALPIASGDAFALKLSADGTTRVFGTYLGGTAGEEGFAVALDGQDRLLLAGSTSSEDFPTTTGAFSRVLAGFRDAFVVRLSADAATMQWGTYFGGRAEDKALALEAGGLGGPVFSGFTCSDDFPIAGAPFQDTQPGPCDGFVARMHGDGSFPDYSGYLGGWRDDSVYGLELGESGRPVVGGETFSTNFPTTDGAYDSTHNSPDDWYDGFVTALRPAAYCTHLTGSSGPLLHIEKAVDGECPITPPEGNLLDLIEGQVELLGPVDIGTVEAVACAAPDATYVTASTPPVGTGLFQLARITPGGSYSDGGGPGLVGSRIPLAGDCP
jgi:hypothetical protein